MVRLIKKIKRSNLSSVLLICLLTGLYIFATSAFAQDSMLYGTAISNLEYKKDVLSYGDVWSFSESLYNESAYGTHNPETEFTYHDSSSTTTIQTTSNYYGKGMFNNKSAITGDPLDKHSYTDFVGEAVNVRIPSVYDQTIPVITTSNSYGSYAVIPNDEGNYHVYVYYESDTAPDELVKYHVIESYTTNDAYVTGFNGDNFTAIGELSFSKVGGTNWWKSDKIVVNNNIWTARAVSVTSASSYGSPNDSGTGEDNAFEGSTANTLLGTTPYNIWSTTEVKFNSLIILQWSSAVKLGPITQEDSIAITSDADSSDNYSGVLKVTNIFGEEIAADGVTREIEHAPLFVVPQAESEDSRFEGFVEVGIEEIGESVYVFDFEKSATITCKWTKADALPTVTIDGNGYIKTSDFYTVPSIENSFVMGNSITYTITPDFTNAEGATISYTISEVGEEDKFGILNGPLSITTNLDDITIVLTATSASGETIKQCVVTFAAADDESLPYVAQNLTTTKKYRLIENAILEANSGDTIVLIADASFRTAEEGQRSAWLMDNAGYTIDPGVTLLIPYSTGDNSIHSGTSQTNDFKHANVTFASSSASTASNMIPSKGVVFELTIPENTTVYIADGSSDAQGRIVVGGTIVGSEGSGYYEGGTYGAHSNLIVNGTLELGNYAVLSTTGYIYGTGEIKAEKTGAELYQPMVLMDWRGAGNAPLFVDTSLKAKVKIHSGENGVAPFSQWGSFNIQTKTKIQSGNYMYLYASLREGSDAYCSHPVLVGDDSIDGLVHLHDGAYLESEYKPIVWSSAYKYGFPGKTEVAITGGADLGVLSLNLKLSVGSVEVSTSDFSCPISYCYSIVMKTGTYNIDKPIALLPGAKVTVEEGAVLNIGTQTTEAIRVMVFDGLLNRVQQNNASALSGGTTHTIEYATSRKDNKNYPTTTELQNSRTDNDVLSGDAELVVNGEIVLGSKASFGGIIQTEGSGIINATAGTVGEVPSATVQIGVTGYNYIITHYRYCAGMSLHSQTARIVANDGTVTDIVRGNTYYGTEYESLQESFSFKYYAEANNVNNVILVGSATADSGETVTGTKDAYVLNESIRGKWCAHSYEDTWQSDISEHWHTCSICGEKKDVAKHEFDENSHICLVCGCAEISIAQMGRTLNYEDLIYVIDIFELVGINTEQVNLDENAGMLVWTVDEYNAMMKDGGSIVYNSNNAIVGLKQYVGKENCYYAQSTGIFTRNLDETAYYAGYIQLDEDTYIYSEAVEYGPKIYASNMLKKDTTREETENLCIALLNYISSAQQYFHYKDFGNTEGYVPLGESELVNIALLDIYPDEDKRIQAWDNPEINGSFVVNDNSPITDDGVITPVGGNLLFEEMISLGVLYSIDDENVQNAKECGTIFWTKAQFEALNGATPGYKENEYGSGMKVKMSQYNDTSDLYVSCVPKIAAKNMSDAQYYYLGYVVDENDKVSYSGIMSYSIEQYISNKAAGSDYMAEFARSLYHYERMAKKALPGTQ